MKINEPNRVSQLLNAYQRAGKAKAEPGTKSAAVQYDGVSLSAEGLEKARELKNQSPERAAHLADVKQAIQDGTYHVTSDAVVRKMLAAYGDDL